MKTLANNVVFLDATHKGLTAYGYVFYALVARTEYGKGTPLAFCISSQDTSEIVATFLRSLKSSAKTNGFTFNPRSFMVDRDTKEIGAIMSIFPASSVLLCWFHVLQAIYRFLNKKDSGISGNANIQKRKDVIEGIRSLKLCTTKEEFERHLEYVLDELPTPAVTQYLKSNWFGDIWSCRWSNYGRKFYHEDHDTNNLVERFFLSIKYHFLGGYTNHRIEDLLMLLHGNVADFYNYIEQLARSGRMRNMRNEKDKRGQLLAEGMMKAGFDRLIEWETVTHCIVPSQTNQKPYEVDLLKATCNCPAAPQGGLCKHYHLAMNVATAKGVCIEQERVQAAANIFEIGDYFHDFSNKSIEIIDNSSCVSVVCTDTFSCSCYANSHGIECICLKVARQIVPSMNSSSLISSNPDNHVDYKPMELSIEDSIRVKLGEINAFVNGDGLRHMSENKKKMLMNSLSNTRNVCVLTDFCKTNRKRKQEPLFPNRKTKSEDHSYACTSTSKTSKIATPRLMEDGGFKNKCRNKGSLRKDY